ncbi:MAG: DNA cytosine methyltransferase [Sulfurospirillaceae bacterium]|nr:DNA cytosine methyltransferase [Sulfurospirillaceae bacterium]
MAVIVNCGGGEHEITAVEYNPDIAAVYKDLYPNDTVIVGDAHEYLLKNYKEFDFIWASPPCQSHSKMVKATRHNNKKYPDFSLYEEIVFLQNFFNGKFIVENVKPYYEPLIKSTHTVGRHIFWSNFNFDVQNIESPKGFISKGTIREAEELKKWLGLDFEGVIYYQGNHCPCQVLRNCVHPKIGKQIFDCVTHGVGTT